MRTRRLYHAVRVALRGCAGRSDYRVVHISIQSNHLHVLVEADHKQALARGMQGLAISASKRINAALGRARGTVFPVRYHATVVATPTQARNALAYVLNNWRRHHADAGAPWRVDPFSSAWQFAGWSQPHGHGAPKEPLPVVAAQTWLLSEGWSRAGPIHLDEVPGRFG